MLSRLSLPGLVSGLLLAAAAIGGSLAAHGEELKALPLRVHIYTTRERTLSRAGRPVAVEGMGQANLYEHGQPHGFDFRFTCAGHVPTSTGYETYPARWKEKPRVLEVFVPASGGKAGKGMRCEMKVEPKSSVYYRRSGTVETEPAAAFKQWMDKHHYDPEHGRNKPTP